MGTVTIPDSMGDLLAPAAHSGTSSLPRHLAAAATKAAEQPYGTRIIASEATIREARACLPALRDKLRPSTDKNRIAILFALADVVGKPDVLRNGDAKAQAVFWMAYHADLGHLPAAVLSRACAAWRRSGEAWFPTTGQLLNLAKRDDEWRHEVMLRSGLEKLSKARSEEPFREMTEDERAEISQRIAALKQRPGAPTPDGPGDDERKTAALERIKQAAARTRPHQASEAA